MKDPLEVIDQLSHGDALAVLRTLAREDERVAVRIVEIATVQLSGVEPEEVAYMLHDELSFLEVEDVWDRAGPTRYGYVEPHEAVDEMMQEVIDPYLDELKKYHKLGMMYEANRMCMGLLWSLRKFEYECKTEFKNWATDAASGFAWHVVDAWKAGSPSPADKAEVKAFIQEELGGWELSLVQ